MSLALAEREAATDADANADADPAPIEPPPTDFTRHRAGLDKIDLILVCIFLLGLYTNYTIQISAKVPFPSAPAGIAGMFLLWRRRNDIATAGFVGLLIVVALYLFSILSATDPRFLARRTNGLLQLTYSLTIGYALFLTITRGSRGQIAGLFLGFALVILIGCLLESFAGLRAISDSVRSVLYSKGIYENDLRDVLLYGRARPKFFASEPASVTFCYSLFTFIWMVVSRYRYKLLLYVGLVGAGIFAMPGPTLLLMLVLVLPYLLFLASRRNGRLDPGRFLKVVCVAFVFSSAFFVVGQAVFSKRFNEISSGNDASFFYRVRGPAMAGVYIVEQYPFAGAGLTGEPFIERKLVELYTRSSGFSVVWQIVSPASELVINYFWLHWIYLGAVWGAIMAIALTCWLRVLKVPSVAFCWAVWAILGQASGAYVGPTCWAVLFLAAAATVMHQRTESTAQTFIDPENSRASMLRLRLAELHRQHEIPRERPLIDAALAEPEQATTSQEAVEPA